MTDLLPILISAIEHHAYCARQCALIHVDGVWLDNGATARGTIGHRRPDTGADLVVETTRPTDEVADVVIDAVVSGEGRARQT